MNRASLSKYLEKFFWMYMFINPALDLLNGMFFYYVLGINTLDVEFALPSLTPSLVVRMLVLLVFGIYLLIVWDKKAILTLIPIGVVLCLSVLSEFLFLGDVALFADVQYITRFAYNIILLFVYARVFRGVWSNSSREELFSNLDVLISYTITLLALTILICYLLGIGYYTYGDPQGFRGNRGFFYAGNDVTAVLLVLTPISAARFMQMKNKKFNLKTLVNLMPSALAANALMIIGTKTAFIAIAATYALLLIYAIVIALKKHETELLIGFFGAFGAVAGTFFVLMIFSGMDLLPAILASFLAPFEKAELDGMQIWTSGREIKLGRHLEMFREGGPLVWLLGMGRGSQEHILEMDVFEVVFYYGALGVVGMLWIYAKAGLDFVKGLFKNFDVIGFALLISVGMCTGYLVMAGHILFSVTSGFYYIFAIIYSRIHFAKGPEDIRLLK